MFALAPKSVLMLFVVVDWFGANINCKDCDEVVIGLAEVRVARSRRHVSTKPIRQWARESSSIIGHKETIVELLTTSILYLSKNQSVLFLLTFSGLKVHVLT